MLGKLMKYEWKSLYKIECIILAVILVVTLMGAVMLHIPIVSEVFEDDINIPDTMTAFFAMSFVSSIVMYVIVLVGASYGSIIYQGVHFYKSMYSDEGYLAHTLPVSGHELLGSKVIINAIWSLIMSISIMASVVILVFSLVHAIDPGSLYSDVIPEFTELFSDIIVDGDIFTAVHYILYFILAFVGGPIAAVCTIFGALTIGQLAKKLRVLFGIIAYFVISFLSNMISAVVQLLGTVMILGLEEFGEYSYNLEQFFSRDMKIIISLAVGAALYFVSHNIITKKLNLQ